MALVVGVALVVGYRIIPAEVGLRDDTRSVGAARTAGPTGTPALVTDNARDVAIRELLDETGGGCFGMALITTRKVSGEELDTRIAAVGGGDRWLFEGSSWVGTLDDAVSAFGGRLVTASEGEAWIAVTWDGRPARAQLVRTVTPGGYTVWERRDQIVAAECPPET